MELKKFLFKFDVSQKDLAEVLGTSTATISQLCSGRAFPSLELAIDIDRATAGWVSTEDWGCVSSIRAEDWCPAAAKLTVEKIAELNERRIVCALRLGELSISAAKKMSECGQAIARYNRDASGGDLNTATPRSVQAAVRDRNRAQGGCGI